MIVEGGERRAMGGMPREQKMLEEHLPRVIYHQVYNVYEKKHLPKVVTVDFALGSQSPFAREQAPTNA